MREMKDSGVEWIGEVPANWRLTKIGQVYDLRNTKVSDFDYEPLSVTMQGIVPQLDSAAKTDAHDARKLVLKGDFVINSRSDRRGSCGIAEQNGSVSLINTVLIPRDSMEPRFYDWLFHTSLFADEFYRNGHGLVDDLWTTKWSEMKGITIVEPSLREQTRIADYLDERCAAIDDDVAKRREIIEKLKEYKKSLIAHAVTKGLDPDAETKDSGVEWIGEVPADWEVVPIKASVSIGHGSDPVLTGDVPVWGSGNEPFKTCGEYKDGPTVLLGRKGTLDCPQLVTGRYWNVDTAFDTKIVDRKLDLKFFYYTAICVDIKPYMTNTAKPSMTQFDWGNSRIPRPSLFEQRRIISYLDERCANIDEAISRQEQLIEKLGEYRKSIIHHAVTGKIDCTEA
ncbi:type I restriction endonuclease subunit S [Bifidobacterium moukalabense]|uniref:type I restriction endonuclease subunit S n=1 Tax=Bifidobacterium moukalabense TaxID=1333651 RepID=UPI0010F789E7|nr:type I restriction endonuclease subunit S [Bifidobacterium moukalabense]